MSKSLGNSLRVSEVVKEHRPIAVRYYLTAAHYRSMIEFHPGAKKSDTTVERIEGFLRRALPGVTTALPTGDEDLPDEFRESMDDDLGVSGALAVIHEAVRTGNTALQDGDRDDAATIARTVIAMTDVLGVNPPRPGLVGRRRWAPTHSQALTPSSRGASRPGPKPGPPVTTTPRIPSATSSPPPASRSRTPLQGPVGPSHGDGAIDMAGNSQRRGAVRTGNKKGPQVGSGGQRRRGLEGKGPTPKATDRPNHKAHKAAERRGGGQAGRTSTRKNKASSEMVAGATPCSRPCAPTCR